VFLARADRELRELFDELGGEAAAAARLSLKIDGLYEAAQARTDRLFWAVADPHGYPPPGTHGALAGAWFHGALCGAMERSWSEPLPGRPGGGRGSDGGVQAFEAESDESGDSRRTLARYGMVRAELQPAFGALAPARAVAVIAGELEAPEAASRDLLGVFEIDGAVVTRNALERVARDPGPPPAHIITGLISYRLHQDALEAMQIISRMPPYDPDSDR